ncbi:MAG: RecQ family ATP-dependent DNA helicase [Gaiellaceae bacterium MAG52_C11]|nr:RecQ family ATP-dependent DNA helicase [Candidatus Gaiellasilicea maunaloa]
MVDDHRRALVVERTGWGKSVVYFIATRLLRDGGAGPTLLISPLLSLMRDQIRMATRLGVTAGTINSTNQNDWPDVERRLAADEVDLLLVSPERLGNQDFQRLIREAMPRGIGLFVVDEAHCISDWGHDFRPDYRRIERLVRLLPPNVPLLATTATANDRVVADVEEQLGPDLIVIRGPLARESLRLQVLELPDQADRLAWLAEQLPAFEASGIVYTLTVADAERVSAWLRDNGIDAPAYHGQLENEQREVLEQRLLDNDVKALVATIALGMGFDKRDLGFVVHYQRPSSAVAYYQQIGRAGRELEDAQVVLLVGHEDDEIADFFIRGAFPGEDILRSVVDTVAATEGVTIRGLEAALNVPTGKLQQAVQLLEVDGALYKEGSRYLRSASAWEPDIERMARVTAERRQEQERMQEFVATDDCLMEFLARELDDPDAHRCGRCANCRGAFVTNETDPRSSRRRSRSSNAATGQSSPASGGRAVSPSRVAPSQLRNNWRKGERCRSTRTLAGARSWPKRSTTRCSSTTNSSRESRR